jgi:hypothetical protein
METAYEQPHLKQSLEHLKIMNIPKSFIWIILFDKAFKYGDSATFRGYVGINVEPLCVEFSNFAKCHIDIRHTRHRYWSRYINMYRSRYIDIYIYK